MRHRPPTKFGQPPAHRLGHSGVRSGVAFAIVTSFAAHVAAISGWLAFHTDRDRPPPRAAPPAPTISAIDIALVPLPAPTPQPTATFVTQPELAVTVPDSRHRSSPRPNAALGPLSSTDREFGRETATTTVPTTVPEVSTPESLSMRPAGRSVHIAPPALLRTYTLPPENSPDIHPPEYQPARPSAELAPSGGGTYQSDRPGFTGNVARDGTVSFEDSRSFTFEVRIPHPVKVARRAAKGLESWYRDPSRDVRNAVRNPSRLCAIDESACPALPDDDEWTGADKKADHGGTVPIFGGAFNPSDAILRQAGIDPYQAEKLNWMERTRDARAEFGRAHREHELKRTPQTVARHLRRLWARTDLDIAAKRAALFDLWDECSETGEAALVDAGAQARAQIVGFIRGHAPAGSLDAYSARELAALNARRSSTAPFAPY